MDDTPEEIWVLKANMDSPYTGTFCDADDGGVRYILPPITKEEARAARDYIDEHHECCDDAPCPYLTAIKILNAIAGEE